MLPLRDVEHGNDSRRAHVGRIILAQRVDNLDVLGGELERRLAAVLLGVAVLRCVRDLQLVAAFHQ